MNETITAIREFFGDQEKGEYRGFDGFVVETDKQVIRLLIENMQMCCEHWGYLWTNDNVQEFVGARLTNITHTDENLVTVDLSFVQDGHGSAVETMFITLETNRGQLQFVAYNGHNGYYGHTARVVSEQLNVNMNL